FTFAVEEETEITEVRRLSDVARELNLRDPLLLKLDVQGVEDKVIIGGEDVVARAKLIIIEVSFQSLFEGGPLFDDVYRILKTRGFTYNGNFDQLLSPEDGRLLDGDPMFSRACTRSLNDPPSSNNLECVAAHEGARKWACVISLRTPGPGSCVSPSLDK